MMIRLQKRSFSSKDAPQVVQGEGQESNVTASGQQRAYDIVING